VEERRPLIKAGKLLKAAAQEHGRKTEILWDPYMPEDFNIDVAITGMQKEIDSLALAIPGSFATEFYTAANNVIRKVRGYAAFVREHDLLAEVHSNMDREGHEELDGEYSLDDI
jgi:hypothetical protein